MNRKAAEPESSKLRCISAAGHRHGPAPEGDHDERQYPRPARATAGTAAAVRAAAAIIAAAAVALLAAACGGGSSSSASSSTAAYRAGALRYAQCMRSHRVIDFPDPDSHGGFPNAGPQESDQVVNSAMRACAHLWHGAVTPAKRTEMVLYFARCMRAHGYPDTPDNGDMSAYPPRVINSQRFISTMDHCAAWGHTKVLGTEGGAGEAFLGPP
jgi:hypothetical protein